MNVMGTGQFRSVDAKWKLAKTPDDLGRMGESAFPDRVAAISVVGKNAKEELQKALGLRNGCGQAIAPSFTRGAREEAAREHATAIELVDIDRLLELMIEEGLGVRETKALMNEPDFFAAYEDNH